MVSDKENITHSGVVPCGLNDHLSTYCTRNVSVGTSIKQNTVKLRSLKNYSAVNLAEDLSKVDWYEVIECGNVNQAWTIFTHFFMLVVDSIAPIKTVRLNPLSPYDASKHHFTNLKTVFILLKLRGFKREISMTFLTIHGNFLTFSTYFKSSSFSTSRELRQQFAACSGQR